MANIQVQFIPISDIIVSKSRFRKNFSEKNLTDLQESISNGPGLLNAVTLLPNMELNTGESRLRAITLLHELGLPVKYYGQMVPEGMIPAIIIEIDMDEIHKLEAELHENTVRESFTFLEEQAAIAHIARLRQALIAKRQEPALSPEERIEAAKAKAGPLGLPSLTKISSQAIKETAATLNDGKTGGSYTAAVKTAIEVTSALESCPELAQKLSKVTSVHDAQKVIKKYSEEELRVNLARTHGKTFSNEMHTVLHGDCIVEMEKLSKKENNTFDVCLTDPIYGIDAGNFSDSGGRMAGFDHSYDDSLETFSRLLPASLKLVSRLLKEKAHIYLACDIRNYFLLRKFLEESSLPGNPWMIPNAPFIQYKIAGGRVPHPGYTPRRSWEMWLYAYRGGKQEYKLINDVIECKADKNESHGAKKPVDLLKTFLSRSCMPGDKVIDFMAGSGSILTACHELKLRCTAIELEAKYYGKCLERLKELK